MSAWIVSGTHIDYMVTAIIHAELSDKSPDEIGRMLWRENLASVACRYPNDGDGDRPGPIGFQDNDVDTYTYRETALLIGGALGKTFGCYDYQSCEHPGYEDSEAHQIVSKIRDSVEGQEYPEDTPWGWDDEDPYGA